MEKVTYRPLTYADSPSIENLIADSFHLTRYVPDRKALARLKHTYLQSCLAEQTFCRAAEKNGALVGVIMCSAKSRYRLIPHLTYLCAELWHTAASLISGHGTRDYQDLHQIYRQLLEGRSHRYDGVLTLFAVDETCRGIGIGRELLRQAEAYLQSCGVRCIYLYTDSTCNTAFYDQHGFSRVDQRVMNTTGPSGEGENSILGSAPKVRTC